MKKAVFVFAIAAFLLPLCGFSRYQPDTDSAELPIIMYHSVSQGSRGAYVISPETLEADLKYLKENGYTSVLTADVAAFVREGKPLPEKPVMLTFDDGHYNFLSKVLPELIEHDFKAVVSIVGSYTDREENEPVRSSYFSYLNRDEISELTAYSRIEVQNHSYRLHSGAGAKPRWGEDYDSYKRRFTADLNKCGELIKECGGNATAFVCPFGSYGGFTVRAVKEAGYQCMLICEEGVNKLTRGNEVALYKLKRFNRPSGMDSRSFFSKIQGK